MTYVPKRSVYTHPAGLVRLRRMDKPSEVTQLLLAWSDGDETALERLMPLVEAELRRLARAYMARERPDHTLQATALVNELCLRLLGRDTVSWRNRAHFMGFAAETMKRILVDHARKRQTRKRGDGVKPLPLDEVTELAERRDRAWVRATPHWRRACTTWPAWNMASVDLRRRRR